MDQFPLIPWENYHDSEEGMEELDGLNLPYTLVRI